MAQYEEVKQLDSRKSKNYASAAALYNLDATRSIQTTHEAHDNVTITDELEEADPAGGNAENTVEIDNLSSLGVARETTEKGKVKTSEKAYGRQEEELFVDAGSLDAYLSGNMPKSHQVWFQAGNKDDAEEASDESSSVVDGTPSQSATASTADHHEPSEASESG